MEGGRRRSENSGRSPSAPGGAEPGQRYLALSEVGSGDVVVREARAAVMQLFDLSVHSFNLPAELRLIKYFYTPLHTN